MSEDAQTSFWRKLFPWPRAKEPKPDKKPWPNYRVGLVPGGHGAGTYITIIHKATGERIASSHYTGSKRAFAVKWDVQDLITQHEKAKRKAATKDTTTDKQKAKLRAEGFDVIE